MALAASAPPDPIAMIAAYAGTWRTQVRELDTEFSKAGSTTSVIHNDCWRVAKFYACAQTVNGKQGALVVYTWDEKARGYATYAIPPHGGPATRGKLVIDVDTWIYPWDQTLGGAVVHVRIINRFVNRDRIEFRQEFSRDGVTWVVASTGLERRKARTP